MITLGDVVVRILGSRKPLDDTLRGVERDVKGFSQRIAGTLNQAFTFALGGIIERGLTSITAGLQGMAATAFNAVASNERLSLSLESLIASQLKAGDATLTMTEALAAAGPIAGELADWINQVAVKSPFSQDDIKNAVQMAQGFKFSTVRAKELEQALVDQAAASGRSGQAIEAATRALGQMNVKGKVQQEELNQLGEAGVDWVRVLDTMGHSLDDVASGSVNAQKFIDTLIQILQSDFGGAAERQATSWAGLTSTFGDIVKIGLREFFQGILEPLQPLVARITDLASSEDATNALREMGQAIGDILRPAIEWFSNALDTIPQKITNFAAFIRQLRDELRGLTVADILAELPGALDQARQQLQTGLEVLARAHEGTLGKLEAEIVKAGEEMNSKLAEIVTKYAPKITDIADRYAKSIRSIQERLTDEAEAQAKRRADIETRILKTQSDLEEKLTELKRDHQRRRQGLVTSLLLAESEEQYLAIQEQIRQEDERFNEQTDKAKEAASEQKSTLEAQLTEQDAAYKKQQSRLERALQEERAERRKALDEVFAERDKEIEKVRETHQQAIDALNGRIVAENEAYAQQQADLKAATERNIADLEATINARAAAIGTGPAAQAGQFVRSLITEFNNLKTSVGEFLMQYADPLKIALLAIGGVLLAGGVIAGIVALAGAIASLINPVTLVVAAVAGLGIAWTQNWGDIQGKTQAVLDFLAPYWDSLKRTLAEFTGQALPDLQNIWQTLVDFWNNSLGPVVSDLSGRFDLATGVATTLAMALSSLKTGLDIILFVLDVVSVAVTLWTTNVNLGLEAVNGFITGITTLSDALGTLWEWLGKIIERFSEEGLKGALSEIGDALPDWLIPGSPTPLENGIRGITDAIKSLPDLGKAFQVPSLPQGTGAGAMPALATAGSAGAGTGAGIGGGPVYFNQTINLPANAGGNDQAGLLEQIKQQTIDLLTQVFEGRE